MIFNSIPLNSRWCPSPWVFQIKCITSLNCNVVKAIAQKAGAVFKCVYCPKQVSCAAILSNSVLHSSGIFPFSRKGLLCLLLGWNVTTFYFVTIDHWIILHLQVSWNGKDCLLKLFISLPSPTLDNHIALQLQAALIDVSKYLHKNVYM